MSELNIIADYRCVDVGMNCPCLMAFFNPIYTLKGCMVFVFGSLFEFAIIKYLESIHENHFEENKEQKRTEIIGNERKMHLNVSPNWTQVYINPLVCYSTLINLVHYLILL